uniref:Uncharacterized protein n=1 Tax=Anopheles atroparvus TaxID=41427 RepID=A0AAG5DSW8_ANOAO
FTSIVAHRCCWEDRTDDSNGRSIGIRFPFPRHARGRGGSALPTDRRVSQPHAEAKRLDNGRKTENARTLSQRVDPIRSLPTMGNAANPKQYTKYSKNTAEPIDASSMQFAVTRATRGHRRNVANEGHRQDDGAGTL